MEKKKLDRIINIIREEMASSSGPTNNVGDEKIALFDPVMRMDKRKRLRFKLPAGLRKRWPPKE